MVFEGLQIKVIYDLYYGIFAAVITLIAILKIGLYFLDCFMYFFVSPFMILWQITIKEKTDRVNSYMVDGFIIYIIKPTLIVSSFLCLLSAFKSGMILAYFIILKGDYKILAKFKYKDETESGLLNQHGERVQTLGGARI